MNKKGFTLIELLCVVSILAILIIIALPNVLSMFNSAKKSAFETELKNVYTAAEEQWISDAFFESGTKVYSHCESGDCGKELKINGRDNLDYYLEFDSKGNVVKYYATDGTYQYRYNGPGLKKSDIKDVEFVSELDEEEVLAITDDGIEGSYSCTTKLTTDIGTFSNGEQEICVNLVNDGFEINIGYTGGYATSGLAYIHVYGFDKFTSSSYIRVYTDSTKSVLLKEITKNDFPYRPNRYSISSHYPNEYVRNYNFTNFSLGNYESDNFYVETSSDIVENYNSTNAYYYIGFTTDMHYTYTNGPWITDPEIIQGIWDLENYAYGQGYQLSGFTNCEDTNDFYDNVTCSGNTYRAVFGIAVG